jgi:hypothetical protein
VKVFGRICRVIDREEFLMKKALLAILLAAAVVGTGQFVKTRVFL